MAKNTSPNASSAGELDDPDDSNEAGQWMSSQHSQSDQPGPVAEGIDGIADSSNSPKSPATMQKRRRVTRACDECRRKKIKCDGKQPCTHCTVYSYECTYDQPSNRRRNPAPQYVEALEKRLHKAEQLLRDVLPEINLDHPQYDAVVPQRSQPRIKSEKQTPATGVSPQLNAHPSLPQAPPVQGEEDSLLESMVHEAGSLNLDDQGHWDFYGHSSGMIFLRRMREQFGDLLGKADGTNIFTKSTSISGRLNSPRSASQSPMNPGLSNVHDLPTKECARKLCSCALDDAAALIRFVHQPSFYAMFDRIYSTSAEEFTPADQKFLPFLYSVLALGCLFAKAEESMLQSYGYESAIDQGFNWFQISRQLMDVTDCHDLMSLQALLFMIMFLQASAKLNTCFSHIGIALRSAIRMGLHRCVPNQFSPLEQETRKRTFWVIRNMDIYVGALLGLPMMLSDDDIDQELPLEVDDACITEEAVLPMPPGKTSLMTAFNAHVRLVRLMAKTVRYVYPLHTTRNKSKSAYVVSHAKIREVEQDLQRWLEDLPMALKPGGDPPPELVRVQQLLRIAYGHIQIILYRPFLHYASQSTQARPTDKRSYACAAACVSISRNLIHITSDMKKRGLLGGAYWFSIYTTFFAVLSLLFYVIENPQNVASQGILRDAHEGRDTLASLSSRSMAADRSSQMLEGLFEQLPEALRIGRLNSASQKKRSAPMQNPPENDSGNTPQSSVQSPAEWSRTTSGAENMSLNCASTNYNSPTAHPQPMANFGSAYDQDSSKLFWLKPPSSAGFQQSPPPMGPVPSSTTPPNMLPSNEATGRGFPDLSTMMFPTNDPFAYPNQPMTTLENLNDNPQDQSFDFHMFNDCTDGESYAHLNIPFYGPLSSYPMPATQGSPRPLGMSDHTWAQQPGQARFRASPLGPNWNAMYGEDWSGGWTDHGYRQ